MNTTVVTPNRPGRQSGRRSEPWGILPMAWRTGTQHEDHLSSVSMLVSLPAIGGGVLRRD